jgi:dihydrofolate reductase
MRRIVMWNRVTADGYFAGPEGGLEWVVPDPELDRSAADAIEGDGVDALLLGRRTYEMFESFWPHALKNESGYPDPHDPGRVLRLSPEMRAMAVMLNKATKFVFSRTLKKATWENSRILRAVDPKAIRAMKRETGKDIMIFGSGSIVSRLTEHRLIDEYQFVVNPVLLGKGQPLLREVSTKVPLTLEETKKYPSGIVLLRYGIAPRNHPPARY